MDYLRRSAAPLPERVWEALDHAVVQVARHTLAARHVAKLDGPRGWEYVAARLGTLTPCAPKEGLAVVCVPDVVLLPEIRADFSLPWAMIEAYERGAPALETGAAEAAAREVALAEDRLAFYGEPLGTGFLMAQESPHVGIGDWLKPGQVVADIVKAVEKLDHLGRPGPYEAVLGMRGYYAYLQAIEEGGYPAIRHLESVLAGVHRSLVLRTPGALFSTGADDFILTVGGDLAVGYREHDRELVRLFCVETLAAQILTPEAVCLFEQ
jgi:uncharacterized linocin/CFP29 family protein